MKKRKKRHKNKQWSTKHHTENSRMSNTTNPTKYPVVNPARTPPNTRWSIQHEPQQIPGGQSSTNPIKYPVVNPDAIEGKSVPAPFFLLLNIRRHSWLRKWRDSNYDKQNKSLVICDTDITSRVNISWWRS